MSDTTTSTDPVTEIRQSFESAKANIEADRSLSAQGKSDLIAAARESANAKIDTIREGVESAVVTERSSLETLLLAAPPPPLGSSSTDRIAHTASYRDAIGRAGMTTTPGELIDLQRTALLTGDALLARATMVVGLQRGDADAVNAWSAANPRLEADVDRLWELTHAPPSVREQIATAMAFGRV